MSRSSLIELLELSRGSVVALCGGGGMISLMYRLADEATACGWRVLCSYTVSGHPPPKATGRTMVLADGIPDLEAHLKEVFTSLAQVLVLKSEERKDKLRGMSADVLKELHSSGLAELMVVVSDGARGRPFKAPKDHEPPVPDFVTHVVIVVGMEVIGRPMDGRRVHRPERVEALAGLSLGGIITPEVVARVVSSPSAYLKKVPSGARCFLYCAKANTPERRRSLAQLEELLAPSPLQVIPFS